MRFTPLLPAALALLLTTASCSQAQSDTSDKGGKNAKSSKGGDRRKDKNAASEIQGLTKVGSLKGVVPESSGLAAAPTAGHYYSFGDDGNRPILYEITGTGEGVGKLDVPADNIDWESLSRDGQGNYYIGDCGNNESLRHDLRIYKFRPDAPTKVGTIAFQYPDQNEFPPKKKQRNFDCEASLWHDGQVWLFTKDRGQSRTSNVYTVPDQPGDYTAKKVTALAIPGQVTDAALRPDGRRLVLLGRGELFILDGNSWADILKATPRQVALTGAGQTEGAVFKDNKTLLISTEQGGLFEYTLP
ncbi:SdiA-regulated/phytase-like domain-containing protein [Hymenobacter properus]|uniref:Esterase-like activity of phytase family protein n=1 Tax=Hymenobacter properus TaxID=2791026 RepID=A0A931BJ82_9BACT|nr:hypothetical protein [Hymenobacter properus]MBF9143511.1 hypothetical protein [Hymenobacter properus]MBR7722324.1 hypothetical protein [Microvirga sp. SRT04]